MIEKLSKIGVLWFDYLYLVIKIIFTLIYLLSQVKFTIVMKIGNESLNSYFSEIIWS